VPQWRGPDAVGAADAEMVSIVRNVRVARYMLKKLHAKQVSQNSINFSSMRLWAN
jgi:hypothetical protein